MFSVRHLHGSVCHLCVLYMPALSVCRKPESQSLVVACSGYPMCKERIFLPRATQDVSVSEEHCQNCNHGIVHKLDLR